MNWDDFEGGEDETAAAELRVCQDGQHQATIVWAGIQQKEWAKNETANPSGKVLTVKIDIGKGIAPVWDSIPAHRRGVVAAVCIAARVDLPKGEWSEACLVGQLVTIETVLAVAKSGREYVRIAKWLPGQAPLPAATARTQPAKLMAQLRATGSDDIPF